MKIHAKTSYDELLARLNDIILSQWMIFIDRGLFGWY